MLDGHLPAAFVGGMRQACRMSSSLPFLLRVAAGLVSDTLDVVKRIPEEIPTLGVTLVGKAAKLSFELNQQLAALAVRGDHALSALSGGAEPPPERTAWSTIDEEDEVAENDPQAAARWDSVEQAEGDTVADLPSGVVPGFDGGQPLSTESVARGLGATPNATPAPSSTPTALSESGGRGQENPDLQPGIAGYRQLSLAQLRGKLRSMSSDQVAACLSFEQAHQARPAFLTLLTNRLSTLAGR